MPIWDGMKWGLQYVCDNVIICAESTKITNLLPSAANQLPPPMQKFTISRKLHPLFAFRFKPELQIWNKIQGEWFNCQMSQALTQGSELATIWVKPPIAKTHVADDICTVWLKLMATCWQCVFLRLQSVVVANPSATSRSPPAGWPCAIDLQSKAVAQSDQLAVSHWMQKRKCNCCPIFALM